MSKQILENAFKGMMQKAFPYHENSEPYRQLRKAFYGGVIISLQRLTAGFNVDDLMKELDNFRIEIEKEVSRDNN